MKINKIGIASIILGSIIVSDSIKLIGEQKKCTQPEYWMWYDCLGVIAFLLMVFLAGKYSKFE